MDASTQVLTDQFLRTYCKRLSPKEMSKFFSSIGVRMSVQDCVEFLDASPYVFALENGMYVTKAGAFTGELFSIKPTAMEYEQRLFVPGSRCLPFVDGEIVSSALTFCVDGTQLGTREGVFEADQAIDMFILYGEEYAPQYIASDPANDRTDLAERDFELPNRVRLTGIDLSLLIEKYGLRKGDRLLCSVQDWNQGVIDVVPVHDGDNTFDRGFIGSMRLQWYQTLEEALLQSFDRMGPCGTVEEQVANVFFEHMGELCIPQCGSLEEYLNRYAKKVGFGCFGVETRLWFKDQNVPAVGKWNSDDIDQLGLSMPLRRNEEPALTFPLEVVDQYVIDSLFRREDDVLAILPRMYPEGYALRKQEKSYMLACLKERRAILSKHYNWFADQENGDIRAQALDLFREVNALVYKIDCTSNTMQDFPQQELVILTQLYSHLFRILQSLDCGENVGSERASLLVSLDGMRWNFEDIVGNLEYAVEKQRKQGFTVLRKR